MAEILHRNRKIVDETKQLKAARTLIMTKTGKKVAEIR